MKRFKTTVSWMLFTITIILASHSAAVGRWDKATFLLVLALSMLHSGALGLE